MARRSFGTIRRLPSKRYQALYLGPDLVTRPAPHTFDTKADANAWLTFEHNKIIQGTWRPPEAGKRRLGDYAETVLASREPDLKPRTRTLYRALLHGHIKPTLGGYPVADLSPAVIREWYTGLAQTTGPTRRKHAYDLLRMILNVAVDDGLRSDNPCRIKGGSTARTKRKVQPATPTELQALADAMPSEKYRQMTLLSGWCLLRFGEATELRRRDVDLDTGTLRVERAVTWDEGRFIVGSPKGSDAGVRAVQIPPHLLPGLRAYVETMLPQALLFPNPDGTHLHHSSARKVFNRARDKVGLPTLTLHGLRHTGASIAAMSGASIAAQMDRGGWSTQTMAVRYQHAYSDADSKIAEFMSRVAVAAAAEAAQTPPDATVTPLR